MTALESILSRVRTLPETQQLAVAQMLLTPSELAAAACIRECGRLALTGQDDCATCAAQAAEARESDVTAATALTLEDLERALADERHLGHGFAERWHLTAKRALRLSGAVVAQANRLELTYEELFAWTNSKYGRYACDEASDDRRTATEIVANYLTPAFVRSALEV